MNIGYQIETALREIQSKHKIAEHVAEARATKESFERVSNEFSSADWEAARLSVNSAREKRATLREEIADLRARGVSRGHLELRIRVEKLKSLAEPELKRARERWDAIHAQIAERGCTFFKARDRALEAMSAARRTMQSSERLQQLRTSLIDDHRRRAQMVFDAYGEHLPAGVTARNFFTGRGLPFHLWLRHAPTLKAYNSEAVVDAELWSGAKSVGQTS